MFKLVHRYFHQHLSLFVIVAGALSFFISNIFMKEILSATHYGHYSIFVTYFSLIYVFGILGTEQVFLRFSIQTKKDTIVTQKFQLQLILVVILFSTILCSFLFKKYYSEITISTLLLFVSSLSMIGSLFLFSILRLNANFVLAQFISNYWKIVLCTLAGCFYIFKDNGLAFFITVVCVNVILIFALSLSYVCKKISISFNNDVSIKEIMQTGFHFFLSIFSFSVLLFADRFIIEMKYSFIEFGNFFYLTNFFLAPYAILQNYIGFKQLIVFKGNFNKDYFVNFNRKALFFGVLLGFFLLLLAFILNYTNVISFRFNRYPSIIVLLLLTGVVRLYSSSIISAFEARTSITTLRKANVYIAGITFIILLAAVFLASSIEEILIYVILIWVFRCFIHRQLLLRQMKISI
ncbi:hypothetical protein D3C84_181910 [compost metagenome]